MSRLDTCLYKIRQLLFTMLGIYLTVLLLAYPALSLAYASKGLVLWFEKMIPTLLPFMILSGIMIRMHLTHQCVGLFHPLFHRIFHTSKDGTYTIFMGFLCGFPMGARIVGELLEAGKLSKEEGSLLLSFCNNIGPIYFLSFVVPVLGIQKPLLPFCIMYGIPLLYYASFLLQRTQISYPPQSTVRKASVPDSSILPKDRAYKACTSCCSGCLSTFRTDRNR